MKRKIFAILLVLALVCSLSITAFAAEGGTTFKISVPDGDTHTYSVYQIFTGDLSGNVLSNVKWGSNATNNGTDVTAGNPVPVEVLNALADVSDSTSDSAKLAVITDYVNLSSNSIATVSAGNSYDAAPGYYLIKDRDSLSDKPDASTTYIVKIVKDVEIARKVAMPTVEKKVHDNKDSTNEAGWFDTADHNMNETFQFKLTATLAPDEDYAAYPSYKVVFNDTMSAGVTFESIAYVQINNATIDADKYSCSATNGATGKWTLTITDIKPYVDNLANGATVTVIYNAHLNADAFVNKANGTTDNKNEVYLEYSNNPNASGEMGKTPTDTVWVFTYGVDNFKFTTKDNVVTAMEGAGFTLLNGNTPVSFVWNETRKAYVVGSGQGAVTEMLSKNDGTFNIIGLDAGTYTLRETTTPAGYNTAEDITVTISATHTETNGVPNVNLDTSQNMTNEILNQTGTVLPETGGIGTTIFYVLGSILVLGAGVLLITKKRMKSE